MITRILHRLKHLDDDNETSLIEQKRVLIYRANTEGSRYKSIKDFPKSDMAANDDEDKSDVGESLDWSAKGIPEQFSTAAGNRKAL